MKLYFDENVVLGDICEISSDEIHNPDVVIGGFPCTGFFIANTKRSMDDECNYLYQQLLRVVWDKQPKFLWLRMLRVYFPWRNVKLLK